LVWMTAQIVPRMERSGHLRFSIALVAFFYDTEAPDNRMQILANSPDPCKTSSSLGN
jgi:hypothetical protein